MMVREASWEDVKMKGEWLYESGAFIIYKESTWEIVADVLGDNGTYTTSVNRRAKAEAYEGNEIPYWDCTCPWGNWAFARETYHGRMCAHAYCLWLYLRDKRRASRVSSVSPRLLTAGRKFPHGGGHYQGRAAPAPPVHR